MTSLDKNKNQTHQINNDHQLITDVNEIIYRTKYLFPFQKGVNKSKLQLYHSSVYSMSLPFDSQEVCQKIKELLPDVVDKLSITDTTANVGGNTLAFSSNFTNVNAIEIDKDIYNSLVHNCNKIYCHKNIRFYNDDCIEKVKELDNKGEQDIIFIDPPWGGPSYKEHDKLQLFLSDTNIYDIIKDWYLNLHNLKLIIVKCPFNFDMEPFVNNINNINNNNDLLFKKTYIQKLKKYNILYIFAKYFTINNHQEDDA
jgi:16S rRNA G966 N2-methylase RsmD